jgi:hypothetical protein
MIWKEQHINLYWRSTSRIEFKEAPQPDDRAVIEIYRRFSESPFITRELTWQDGTLSCTLTPEEMNVSASIWPYHVMYKNGGTTVEYRGEIRISDVFTENWNQ